MTVKFCMVDISRFTKAQNRHDIVYPSIPSSFAPVLRNGELPQFTPQSKKAFKDSAPQEIEKEFDDEYKISYSDTNSEPHLPSQQDLDLLETRGSQR